MRLWIDPVKLAGYGLTPMDVRNAINRENVELPSGSIEGTNTQLTIRTMGLMTTPREFNDLIIKQSGDLIVRFQDIGRAELGPEDIRGILKRDGIPMIMVAMIPQPGSNHIDIVDEVYRRLEYIKKDLPDDVQVNVNYDNTEYIRSSIKEVKDTIYIAFILVVLIIYFFLRSWRATLIPILVIPVSLVGSFFIMYLAGFTINVLTLLALVLAIGIVVDDAIVVMENIYVKVESGMNPVEAGLLGSKEIYFAIISTTITLISVFFPIVFLEGITGRLFREFSIAGNEMKRSMKPVMKLTTPIIPIFASFLVQERFPYRILLITMPANTGMKSILRILIIMPIASTSMSWPANNFIRNGLAMGDISVVSVVTVIERARFPFAR